METVNELLNKSFNVTPIENDNNIDKKEYLIKDNEVYLRCN